jgi:tRNA modification GTPase
MPSDEVTPDTIAAVATPPGRGGIGVVRVSGPNALQVARAVLGRVPPARKAAYGTFNDATGAPIDAGLALYFEAPASYTGEAVLELHGHGGPVVMHTLLAAVLDAGARLAEPGEFTRRAFLNGRLDLAQAEAVADLIEASSAEAARSALRSLSGEFSAAIDALVGKLTELRALTEAMLDFPAEEIDSLERHEARDRLAAVQGALEEVLARSRQGSLLRSGIQVVLAGPPNVGKSSLLNRLAGEERAIVTAIPGTTRDALRETIQVAGVPMVLVDTAGLRDSADEIERLGMERTHMEMRRADLVLDVLEAGTAQTARRAEVPGHIRIINKIDLLPGGGQPGRHGNVVHVSARTGAGMDALREALLEAAGWRAGGESVFLARERHLRALDRAKAHLAAAMTRTAQWELFAEELRLAQEALGEISGRVTAEDLLGEIFTRFCIGK